MNNTQPWYKTESNFPCWCWFRSSTDMRALYDSFKLACKYSPHQSTIVDPNGMHYFSERFIPLTAEELKQHPELLI